MTGPDHKASIEPNALFAMVAAIRNIELAMGDGIKEPKPSELKNRSLVQKYILAAKDIKEGDLLQDENLIVKRAKGDVPAAMWDIVIGSKAKKSYKVDQPIKL